MSTEIHTSPIYQNERVSQSSTEENRNQPSSQESSDNETTTGVSTETTEEAHQQTAVLLQTTVPDSSTSPHQTTCNNSPVSHQSEDSQSVGHPIGLGPSPSCGEAIVSEAVMTEILESPPVSPPPQYCALPVTVTDQVRIIMLGSERVPDHVTMTVGDSPPSYDAVVGLHTFTNPSQTHMQTQLGSLVLNVNAPQNTTYEVAGLPTLSNSVQPEAHRHGESRHANGYGSQQTNTRRRKSDNKCKAAVVVTIIIVLLLVFIGAASGG